MASLSSNWLMYYISSNKNLKEFSRYLLDMAMWPLQIIKSHNVVQSPISHKACE